MYPYMPPYYIPAPPEKKRSSSKARTLKQMLRDRQTLDELIEGELKRKKEKDKPKPRTFSSLEMVGLLTFFSPIVGILWIVAMYNLQSYLAETLKFIVK